MQLPQILSEILNLLSNMYTIQTWSVNLEHAVSTNLKHQWTVKICVSCKFQIWPKICSDLLSKSKFGNELVVFANWFTYCKCICVAFKFGIVFCARRKENCSTCFRVSKGEQHPGGSNFGHVMHFCTQNFKSKKIFLFKLHSNRIQSKMI